MAAAGKDERQGEVGNRGVQHSRRVRHHDPALAARANVDAVVADAVVRHQAKVGEQLEFLRPDRDDRLQEDFHAGERLHRRPRLEERHLRQFVPRRAGKRLRRGDRHGRSISALRHLASVSPCRPS